MQIQKNVLSYVLNHFTSATLTDFDLAARKIDAGLHWKSSELLREIPLLIPFERKFGVEGFDCISELLFQGVQAGLQLLHPLSTDYPPLLKRMASPPLFLTMKGRAFWKERPLLAVVGNRQPQTESIVWLEELLKRLLSYQELGIVSGGARGIDQIAHRACVRAQRPTAVVFPSGLNEPYPKTWLETGDSVLAGGGALLSEYLPKQEMKKHFFPRRNRLIAGLGVATLVVEARTRSGTLLTAKQTLEQGKPVFVMPTHPMDEKGRGGLNLICEGATPVRDFLDLSLYLAAELPGKIDDFELQRTPTQEK